MSSRVMAGPSAHRVVPLSIHHAVEITEWGHGEEPVLFLSGHEQTPLGRARLLATMALHEPKKKFIAPYTAGTHGSSSLRPRETPTKRIHDLCQELEILDEATTWFIGESAGAVLAVQSAAALHNTRAISVVGPVLNSVDQMSEGIGLATEEFWHDSQGFANDMLRLDPLGALMRSVSIGMRHANPLRLWNAIAADEQIRAMPQADRDSLFAEGRGFAIYGREDLTFRPPTDPTHDRWIHVVNGGHDLLDRHAEFMAEYLVGLMVKPNRELVAA